MYSPLSDSTITSCFCLSHIVLPQEIDALGHVNNTIYLQWMERVAWAHAESLGMSFEVYQREDAAMVAREHHMTYLLPCLDGQLIELRTWLGEQNALHSHRHYEFWHIPLVKDHLPSIAFKAHTDWVCVSLSSGKPRRMPLVFQQAYGIHQSK